MFLSSASIKKKSQKLIENMLEHDVGDCRDFLASFYRSKNFMKNIDINFVIVLYKF